MRHVGAIEPFALLDERLGPQHLFRRTQLDRLIEDQVLYGVLEPVLVDARNAVA
jgi:hypothetical protein